MDPTCHLIHKNCQRNSTLAISHNFGPKGLALSENVIFYPLTPPSMVEMQYQRLNLLLKKLFPANRKWFYLRDTWYQPILLSIWIILVSSYLASISYCTFQIWHWFFPPKDNYGIKHPASGYSPAQNKHSFDRYRGYKVSLQLLFCCISNYMIFITFIYIH